MVFAKMLSVAWPKQRDVFVDLLTYNDGNVEKSENGQTTWHWSERSDLGVVLVRQLPRRGWKQEEVPDIDVCRGVRPCPLSITTCI